MTSTAIQTGRTTFPATPGGTTTVVTFVPFVTQLATITRTTSTTGRTTLPATNGGTTTIVTFVTPRLTTITRTTTTTGLTTLPANSGGTTTIASYACAVTSTISASNTVSVTASFTVPACAKTMQFVVNGGAGGNSFYGGGRG